MYYFTDGVKIYYTVEGEGEPLLIFHGFSIDHRGVKGVVEESIHYGKYRRIYIDLPGMGKSPAPNKMINANKLLTILINFIDTVIGKRSFSVLGYSYGGYLALGIVKVIPKRVDKLVLLAPVVNSRAKDRKLTKTSEKKIEFFQVKGSILFEQYKESAILVTEQGYQNYVKEISPGLSTGDPVFQKTFQETGYAFDFEKSLLAELIVCECLIVLGKQDVVVGFEDILEHRNKFLNSNFVLLENAGHNLQLDKREQVITEIRTFLCANKANKNE